MRSRVFAAAIALSVLIVPAAIAADASPPKLSLVRGTVTSFDGKTLVLKTASGALSAPVAPKLQVSAVEPRRFDQIKATDFVGITSVDGENGHLKAEEIHIIPITGLGEGQYPWDHHPDGLTKKAGSMTNGTVALVQKPKAGSMTNAMVSTTGPSDSGGWQLKVGFKGAAMVNGKCVGLAAMVPADKQCSGTSIVDVSPSTPIVMMVPAKAEDVKPGLAVFGTMLTDDKGASVITSLTVEKNGVKPQF